MRLALALAATIAVPVTAVAEEAPPPPPEQLPAGPAPAEPAPTTAPGETPPKVDPAYGDYPDRTLPEPADGRKNFPAPRGKDIVIVAHPDRSKSNITVLAALGGGGVVFAAVGLYFHLDARTATSEVEASKFTGEPWTRERQATYERAESSSMLAGVFYGIGGALVLATAITYIATEPKAETITIHPYANPKPVALVAPTRGGAMVGGMWRF